MRISSLRALDIREKDEEDLVQDVLNAKLAHIPAVHAVDLPFVEIRTKEQEDARQREIDALNEASRRSLLGEDAISVEELPENDAPEEIPAEIPAETTEEVPVAKKKGRPKKTK